MPPPLSSLTTNFLNHPRRESSPSNIKHKTTLHGFDHLPEHRYREVKEAQLRQEHSRVQQVAREQRERERKTQTLRREANGEVARQVASRRRQLAEKLRRRRSQPVAVPVAVAAATPHAVVTRQTTAQPTTFQQPTYSQPAYSQPRVTEPRVNQPRVKREDSIKVVDFPTYIKSYIDKIKVRQCFLFLHSNYLGYK